MIWIALKMLTGDRAKFLGIVFGVTFATLLMSQQLSLFLGIMKRTTSQILDVRDADIWVMDNKVRFIDEVPALPDEDLYRVRSVPGVQWAVRFFKNNVIARLEDGNARNVVLFGLDDATLVGAPQELLAGDLFDLRKPDAVIVDDAGYKYMFPGEPIKLGRELEINDHRAVIVGVCKVSPPFTTGPIMYTRFSQATVFSPQKLSGRSMNFVLAQPADGLSAEEVCGRIKEKTGLQALTRDQFFWKTINYFLSSTGIPVNFGITVMLGFVVGVAIAGQTFYLFTIENLKQFGALKAMGVSNLKIVGMILTQAVVVGAIGYGLGIGLAACFFESTGRMTHLAGLGIPWQVLIGAAFAVMIIVVLASLMSIRRVLVLEPAEVFR